MKTFIKKIVAGQKKMFLIMAIALTLLSSFEYVLLVLYSSNETLDSTTSMMIRLLPSITLFVSFFLTFYLNNFFVDGKREEFSIILLSGRNTNQVLKYIVLQFGTLYLLTAVIGGLLGQGAMSVFLRTLNTTNGESIFIFDFSYTIVVYIIFVIVKILYIILINFGKFVQIQNRIVEYMNQTAIQEKKISFSSMFVTNEKKRKIPLGPLFSTIFSIAILAMSIHGIFTSDTDSSSFAIYILLALAAEITLVNKTVPMLYNVLHDSYLLKHPIALHALNQLMDLSNVLVSVININAVIVPAMFIMTMLPFINVQIKYVVMVCYFILLIIVVLSFVVRFSVYLPTKAMDIATLKAIGYSEKQIGKIQNWQIIGFLIFMVGIPAFIYGIILFQAYSTFWISLSMVYLMIGSYTIVYIALSLFMIYSYKQFTKEVINDVKYLNRGQ